MEMNVSFSEFIGRRDVGVAMPADELRDLEDRLRRLCRAIANDPVDESDEAAAARTYVAQLAEAGLLGLLIPASHGGTFPSLRSTPICVARQWLARQSGALDTAFIMQGLGSYPITLAGSTGLRDRQLRAVARGTSICAFALTEAGAGSDVGAMSTVAEADTADSVRLTGEKCFISNAGIADSYVVFAREGAPKADGRPRYGAFWVPADAPGLTTESIQVIAPHPIGTVRLDQVAVPAARRLGEPGTGLRTAFATLEVFRVTVGAAALGLADRAMKAMVEHLKQRVQFGRPLAAQQGLRFAAADVATEHMAAQLLVYRAAAARDGERSQADQVAMAKLFATEAAQRVVDRAVQSLGGLGVTVGHPVERLYREVRALRIYEGTSEIQKLVIARALFDGTDG